MRSLAWLVVLMLGPAVGHAQTTLDAPRVAAAASQAKDLEFPKQPSKLSTFTTPKMAIYKPDGPGPFPAIVLFHQCGGLVTPKRPNESMLEWAKESVAHGYVVLLIDAFSQRNVDTVCLGPKNGVVFPRGVKDALQAAEHLRTFDFVDTQRVALAGYSWGAMVGLLASSRAWATALAPGERFAAVVSMYPGCFTIPAKGGSYEIGVSDVDRPLLVLMGEADTETPPATCVPKLEAAKAAGAPVEWHVYPATTHCFDCRQLDGLAKTDVRGSRVVYHYDKDVTRDAARRMFEFLDRALAVKR